jgi:hypothetical protein
VLEWGSRGREFESRHSDQISLDFSSKNQGFFIFRAKQKSAQLVDISKLGLNRKIKKFSYSFICGKGYSPSSGGE